MRPLMTANGHGVNPVFCVKFDQTGQFVFTGADDGLVKVSKLDFMHRGNTEKGNLGRRYINERDLYTRQMARSSGCVYLEGKGEGKGEVSQGNHLHN